MPEHPLTNCHYVINSIQELEDVFEVPLTIREIVSNKKLIEEGKDPMMATFIGIPSTAMRDKDFFIAVYLYLGRQYRIALCYEEDPSFIPRAMDTYKESRLKIVLAALMDAPNPMCLLNSYETNYNSWHPGDRIRLDNVPSDRLTVTTTIPVDINGVTYNTEPVEFSRDIEKYIQDVAEAIQQCVATNT